MENIQMKKKYLLGAAPLADVSRDFPHWWSIFETDKVQNYLFMCLFIYILTYIIIYLYLIIYQNYMRCFLGGFLVNIAVYFYVYV